MRDALLTPRTRRYQIGSIITGLTPRNDTVVAGINALVAAGSLVSIDPATFGLFNSPAACDSCSINAGTKVLTSTDDRWSAADVGKAIHVAGAGTAGGTLVSVIDGYTDAKTVTLRHAAVTTTAATATSAAGLAVWGNAPSLTLKATTLVDSSGSSLHSLTPAVSGGANRQIGDVVNFFNVKDFQAVGNGIANDLPAIQKAIDACFAAGGGVVKIPAGTYRIDPPQVESAYNVQYPSIGGPTITLRSGVSLVGDGRGATTLLVGANAANGSMAIGTPAAGVVRAGVSDLTIDGNRAENANGVWGVYMDASQGCIIERVRIYNTTSHGVFINTGSVGNRVVNCEIEEFGQATGGFGVLIFNGSLRNVIESCTVTSSRPNVGIACDSGTVGFAGLSASDNTIDRCSVIGGNYGILVEDSHRCGVLNNNVSGQLSIGILVTIGQDNIVPLGTRVLGNAVHDMAPSGTGVAISVKASLTAVRGNTLSNNGVSVGVKLEKLTVGGPSSGNVVAGNHIFSNAWIGILVEEAKQAQVTDNELYSIGGIGIHIAPTAACSQVIVARNIIDTTTGGASRHGIMVDSTGGNVSDLSITENKLRNLGVASVADAIQIYQNVGTVSGLEISSNTVLDDQGGPTTRHAVQVSGTVSTADVFNNKATGITGNRLYVNGAAVASSDSRRGTATFGVADTTKAVAFPIAEPATSYTVVLGTYTASGAPAVGAYRAHIANKTVNGFDIVVEAAPGAGASVTIDWTIAR
jgi:parallel beta-helix repeat protein